MGMDTNTADVLKLLKDDKFVNEIVKKVVDDSRVLDGLAAQMADKMSDALEDDPVIKQKLIDAAMESPDFRKKVVKELVDEISD